MVAALPSRGDGDAITITQASPIEKLDAQGTPCGVSMASVGATYVLVKTSDDKLIVKDPGGVEYMIATAATNYSAPSAEKSVVAEPPPSQSAQPAPAAQPHDSTVTIAAPNPSTADKDEAAKIKAINNALGVSLLADAQFWQDNVADVGRRLDWPRESKTASEESYRRYAGSGEALVFGASAYSLALYGKSGKPTYVSIIFANAGDFPEAQKSGFTENPQIIDGIKKHLAVAVKKDAETITSALTPILGEPSISLFGNSSSNRDEVHRWDWNGVSFLLNSHQGEYASLKLVPSEAADHFGTVDVTDRDEMRDILAKRVVKRDNGDVVVSELPMVDQGPKGYCVPATWERYLRYMDVPADLYVLAIMGNSGLGGGTSFHLMEAGVGDYVSAYHRRIENYDGAFDVSHIAKYIDQGLPLMWTCWVTKPVELQTSRNTEDRKTVTDWSAYSKTLVAQDKAFGPSFQAEDADHSNGHMRLIIGYNAATDEIAISDSWGAAMAERWLYIGTAKKISQNEIAYLTW